MKSWLEKMEIELKEHLDMLDIEAMAKIVDKYLPPGDHYINEAAVSEGIDMAFNDAQYEIWITTKLRRQHEKR